MKCAGNLSDLIENTLQDGNVILSNIKKTDFPNPNIVLQELVNFLLTNVLKNTSAKKELEIVQTQLELLFDFSKGCQKFEEILKKSEELKKDLPDANITCRLVGTAPVSVASGQWPVVREVLVL